MNDCGNPPEKHKNRIVIVVELAGLGYLCNFENLKKNL